jgi:glycosyl transferase, family 25
VDPVSQHILGQFDQVRIINLADRSDRRREMVDQLAKIGGLAPNIAFYDAQRPSAAGGFPSVGARGCFDSHLNVLRGAARARAKSLLLLEDDFDFSREGLASASAVLGKLWNTEWDIFYGAHILPNRGRQGLVSIAPDEAVQTASFIAFRGPMLRALVQFLEEILERPQGSPDYGPMHVDGAYTVFRQLHPEYQCFAAFPTLGRQRSSVSDITPSAMLLDRWSGTRRVSKMLRRAYNRLRN